MVELVTLALIFLAITSDDPQSCSQEDEPCKRHGLRKYSDECNVETVPADFVEEVAKERPRSAAKPTGAKGWPVTLQEKTNEPYACVMEPEADENRYTCPIEEREMEKRKEEEKDQSAAVEPELENPRSQDYVCYYGAEHLSGNEWEYCGKCRHFVLKIAREARKRISDY